LVNPTVNTWVHNFSRRPEGKHLPYALACEINNSCFIHLARFASNSNWTRAILEGTPIPFTALDEFRGLFQIIVNNWRAQGLKHRQLSHYSSPPSTWFSPETSKEASKKAAKTSDNASPGNKPAGRNGGGAVPPQASNSTRLDTKDPHFGMIIVPDNIRHGPQLPSGKQLCLPFTVHGKACTNGYNCTNAHVTLTRASILDLKAIKRWGTNTPNVEWALGRPKRLSAASSAPTPASPKASSPPAQVSPQAVAANGSQASTTTNSHSVSTLATPVETLSTQELFARAAASAEPLLPVASLVSPPLTNLEVKHLLPASATNANVSSAKQQESPVNAFSTKQSAQGQKPAAPKQAFSLLPNEDNVLPSLLDGNESGDDPNDEIHC
jgi:hypothetical protein